MELWTVTEKSFLEYENQIIYKHLLTLLTTLCDLPINILIFREYLGSGLILDKIDSCFFVVIFDYSETRL